jgi:Family of unknown function (DUF6152)
MIHGQEALMRYLPVGVFAGAILVLITVVPLNAHHAIAAKFDPDKALTLNGTVVEIDWANPHAHLFIDVKGLSSIANWAIELESPVDLQRSGWNRDTVKPGDSITVQGIPARDGSKQAWANSVVVTSTNKRVFTLAAAPRRDNQPARPTPRWPDGQPRLGPLPGERGYWGSPTSTSLVQSGSNVQVAADGLLRNLADIDKVAPFQRWARDLYELRQRSYLRSDPMFLLCMPPGGPRQFQLSYGVQFLEDREKKRIFVLMGSGNHNWRLIYTDGRSLKDDDKDFPTYYGRALGKWEGDALVVDTKNFNEKFWFTNGGLPHTGELHLIERISRPDFNTLKYEVTIDDPGAYTKTWSSSWNLQWFAGEELPPYYCQDNRP